MVLLQGACFPSCKYHELNLFPAPGVYKYNEVNSVQFGEKCQLHSTLKQFAHIQTYPQLSYGHCNHYHCISFNLWGLTKVLSHIKMEQIGCLLNTHWKHKADSRCLQVVVGSCLFVFYIVITHTSTTGHLFTLVICPLNCSPVTMSSYHRPFIMTLLSTTCRCSYSAICYMRGLKFKSVMSALTCI